MRVRPCEEPEIVVAGLQQGFRADPQAEQGRARVRGLGGLADGGLGKDPSHDGHGARSAGGGFHVDAHGTGSDGRRGEAVGVAQTDAHAGVVGEVRAAVAGAAALGAVLGGGRLLR
ncbi:hypothetical protein GCM10017674_67910 [Streptomyces gardneri]|nr:hypothetical protein GCM10017674_67910 [Streptomyces gardneri]